MPAVTAVLTTELAWEPFSSPSRALGVQSQAGTEAAAAGVTPRGSKEPTVKRSPWLEDKGRLKIYPVDLSSGSSHALLNTRNIFYLCPHINSNQ